MTVTAQNEASSNVMLGLDYFELCDGERAKNAFPSTLKAENPDLGVKYVTDNGSFVYECEAMTVAEGYNVEVQDLAFLANSERWSNKAHMWWKCMFPGDEIVLEFNSDKSGLYTLQTLLTKAGDYGAFNIYFDDTLVFEALDLYNDGVDCEIYTYDTPMEIAEGTHRITVDSLDCNENSVGFYFGIDYMMLVPVAEEPAAEEPAAEEPVVEEPVVEEPVVEEVIEKTVAAPQTFDVVILFAALAGMFSAAAAWIRRKF